MRKLSPNQIDAIIEYVRFANRCGSDASPAMPLAKPVTLGSLEKRGLFNARFNRLSRAGWTAYRNLVDQAREDALREDFDREVAATHAANAEGPATEQMRWFLAHTLGRRNPMVWHYTLGLVGIAMRRGWVAEASPSGESEHMTSRSTLAVTRAGYAALIDADWEAAHDERDARWVATCDEIAATLRAAQIRNAAADHADHDHPRDMRSLADCDHEAALREDGDRWLDEMIGVAEQGTRNDRDMADQVTESLTAYVEEFDVDGIVRALIAAYGLVNVNDIDTHEYWAIVHEHPRASVAA